MISSDKEKRAKRFFKRVGVIAVIACFFSSLRTRECGEEDETGDDGSVHLEPLHDRMAQYLLPCAAIAEAAPRAVPCEAPVRLDGERGSEHPRVKHERGAEVRREAILRHARHRAVRDEVRRVEPGLHHVPPEHALRAEQPCHTQERTAQRAREAASEGEVAEGEDEGEADGAPEDAMAPFHIVDRLEVVERHARVEPKRG